MFTWPIYIRPFLEFSSPVWNTGFVGDSRLLESVLRRWTKKVQNGALELCRSAEGSQLVFSEGQTAESGPHSVF